MRYMKHENSTFFKNIKALRSGLSVFNRLFCVVSKLLSLLNGGRRPAVKSRRRNSYP
jgi:hypothetical protein